MNKLEEWAKDKPDSIRSISLLLASSGEKLYNIFKDYNKFLMKHGIVNIHEIDVWTEYYRNEKNLYEKLKELLIKSVENNNVLINFVMLQTKELFSYFNISFETALNNINILSSDDKVFLIKKFEGLNINNFLGKIGDELALPMSKEKILHIPEFVFLARVWFPCWIMYGEYPSMLFEQARLGEIEALCKLLRLDKAIIHDKKIGAFVQKMSLNPESEEFRKITNALKSTVKITSPKKMKMRLASFISKYASFLGIELNAPQIQKLFDSISQNMFDEKFDDTDLPESPEAFYMNLRRQRNTWNFIPDSLPHPNKK